ncbi:hypothetical protein FPQ18DRAFT_420469 [Pyronema domesticum]|nr:hypothetical protein FPQ18DRAFT_420469 [Pyronema domesticum]
MLRSTRTWTPAALIFVPETPQDISTALRIISFFSIPFAVRSGGHTPFPGPASSDGGLLISLEKLTHLSISADKNIASVGPGNRWVDVYRYLELHGKSAVGGRVPSVGVGGLLTGGGISFYSTHYGMACDMVQSYQVVLSDGRIVTASSQENKDLFKALKGGSNNFGIVTRFNLLTVPSPKGVWGGIALYTPDKIPAITKAIEKYQRKYQLEDPDAAMIQNFLFANEGKLKLWHMMKFHATTDNPESLKEWTEIGPISDDCRRGNLSTIVTDMAKDYEDIHFRNDFRTLSIGVSAELYQILVALCEKHYSTITSIPGMSVSLTFQPMAASTLSNDGNVLGAKKEAQTWLELCTYWNNSSDDERVLGVGKAFIKEATEEAKKRELLYEFLYLNDAAKGQPVIEGYGKRSVEFLKGVSRKYDQRQVFQKLIGGFKLPA